MEKNLRRASVLCLVFAAVLYFVFEGMRFSALLFVCAAAVFALLAWLAARKKRTLMRMLCALLALGFAFFGGINPSLGCTLSATVILGADLPTGFNEVTLLLVAFMSPSVRTPSISLPTLSV